jgi:hypothetical protein
MESISGIQGHSRDDALARHHDFNHLANHKPQSPFRHWQEDWSMQGSRELFRKFFISNHSRGDPIDHTTEPGGR